MLGAERERRTNEPITRTVPHAPPFLAEEIGLGRNVW